MGYPEITHELEEDFIHIHIRVPLVYETSFEVLEMIAVPNLAEKTILKTPDNWIMINELLGTFAYLAPTDVVERLAPEQWIVERLNVKRRCCQISLMSGRKFVKINGCFIHQQRGGMVHLPKHPDKN